jgi:adenylate kinase
VKRITGQGLLVPDEIVEEVVRERLEQHDWNYGFVLDGFPRTLRQAEYLFERWNVDQVIYLDLPDDVVQKRVAHRAKIGEGQGFTKRVDDNPESLRMRLREYHEKTKPLQDLYQAKGILVSIDADRPINVIFEDIQRSLCLGDPVDPAGLREALAEEESRALR